MNVNIEPLAVHAGQLITLRDDRARTQIMAFDPDDGSDGFHVVDTYTDPEEHASLFVGVASKRVCLSFGNTAVWVTRSQMADLARVIETEMARA